MLEYSFYGHTSFKWINFLLFVCLLLFFFITFTPCNHDGWYLDTKTPFQLASTKCKRFSFNYLNHFNIYSCCFVLITRSAWDFNPFRNGFWGLWALKHGLVYLSDHLKAEGRALLLSSSLTLLFSPWLGCPGPEKGASRSAAGWQGLICSVSEFTLINSWDFFDRLKWFPATLEDNFIGFQSYFHQAAHFYNFL